MAQRHLSRLTRIDAQARRLQRRIQTIANRIDDPAAAFKARLTVGGLMVELVSHVPNLPSRVWGDLTGMRDLQSAYMEFETRVVASAEAFVQTILSDRRRTEPPPARLRRRRSTTQRCFVGRRSR